MPYSSPNDEEYQMDHERSVQEAESVWFSGYFSGKSYVAAPMHERHEDLFDDAHLTQTSYVVPRGYTYNAMNLPEILHFRPGGFLRLMTMVYTGAMAAACVLMLVAACPIPWFSGKSYSVDGETVNMKNVKWSLWEQKGGDFPTIKVKDMGDCPVKQQFFRAMEGCAIASTCFAFFAFVEGILKLVKGSSAYFMMLLLSFFAVLWGVCANGMAISLYTNKHCNVKMSEMSSLSAGFALSLVSWVLSLVAFLALAVATHFNVGPSLKRMRTYDTVYFLLLFSSLVMATVAGTRPIFHRKFNDDLVHDVRIGYWREEVTYSKERLPLIMSRAQFRCKPYDTRMKASIAFLILGCVALFFATVLSIPGFLKKPFRAGSCVVAIIAVIFLTINWVIVIVLLKSEYCQQSVKSSMFQNYPGVPSGIQDGLTKFPGYSLSEGAVLPIVAWILTLVAVIANICIPWPKDKKPLIK